MSAVINATDRFEQKPVYQDSETALIQLRDYQHLVDGLLRTWLNNNCG
jgi:hypothetical protein